MSENEADSLETLGRQSLILHKRVKQSSERLSEIEGEGFWSKSRDDTSAYESSSNNQSERTIHCAILQPYLCPFLIDYSTSHRSLSTHFPSPSNQFTLTPHATFLFYNKEYLAAFGTEGEEGENWREVYFARWTPARSVLYERAFRELDVTAILGWETDEKEQEARDVTAERRRREMKKKEEEESKEQEKSVEVKAKVEDQEVIMIGAGAGAEIIALGCILGSVNDEIPEESRPKIEVQAIDQGSWGELVRKMDEGIKEE